MDWRADAALPGDSAGSGSARQQMTCRAEFPAADRMRIAARARLQCPLASDAVRRCLVPDCAPPNVGAFCPLRLKARRS